jgi:hypothetical protein
MWQKKRDHDWYREQLGVKLKEMQQATPGAGLDFDHVIRKYGAEFASQLSSPVIAQIIEQTRGRQGAWVVFRGILLAEQERRQSRYHSINLLLVGLTLLASIAAFIATILN